MGILNTLFGKNTESYQPKITVSQVEDIFSYGKQRNLTGTGFAAFKIQNLGANISWQAEPYFYTGYKNIPAQQVPANIQWYNNPFFAYVSISEDQVHYHYGEHGESAVFLCPETTDPKHIKLIDELFAHYYQSFGLPGSLKVTTPEKTIYDKSDKMKFLTDYLISDSEDFYDYFYDDDADHIVMFVDWREYDEDIITYCERIIKSGKLSVKTLDAENERGFVTLINYKDEQFNIPYQGAGADRDTTLITLNTAIAQDYELRLLKESLGNDTLALVPLSNAQWKELELQHPEQVEEKFSKLIPGQQIF